MTTNQADMGSSNPFLRITVLLSIFLLLATPLLSSSTAQIAPGHQSHAPADTTAPIDSAVTVPGYLDSPTFFEMFHANHSDPLNRTLLHKGEVRLNPLGTESIENFDWKTHKRKDQSWWQRMESMKYLLPLMTSSEDRDSVFVRKWIMGWLDKHEREPLISRAAHDAMTVGQRGMVFTWFLKQLNADDEQDTALAGRIKASLRWHQTYLTATYHAVSNHAMWESMGLLETTRVHPNPKLSFIALERLREIVELSTTEQGFHTEHSPVYHFYYLRWLSDFADYLVSLPDLDWPDLELLLDRERRMHKMTYFLCDRRGRLPQIGDTDSIKVDAVYWRRPPLSNNTAVFDKDAGYAIYKDPLRAKNRRYVVFRIIQDKPELPFHTHDDCLAVYYSWDGEVILSDQGRFSYTRSATQKYYKSMAAHNTVMPAKLLTFHGSRFYAREAWWKADRARCFFGASADQPSITRAVEIPAREPELRVFDTILGEEPYSLLWYIGSDVVSIDEQHHWVNESDSTDRWHTYSWKLTTVRKRCFLLTVELSCGQNDDDQMVHIIKGWEKPMLGWYSSGYNKSVPANLIRVDLNVNGFANVRTKIKRIR
ncbi:MAG: heparinase II/III family protein [Candidatus Latescibacterota bacterium]|nr:MAG: heparinase II/III family protein [Candidatus Latescibacterota bacterium]